jgi:hypothetical protein
MVLSPGINKIVNPTRQSISIQFDLTQAIYSAAFSENLRFRTAAAVHGLQHDTYPEDQLFKRLDILASHRIHLWHIHQTIVSRSQNGIRRWDRSVLLVMHALKTKGLFTDLCRKIADHLVMTPKEWQSGHEIKVYQSINMATLESGKVNINARILTPLQPNQHYRIDFVDESPRQHTSCRRTSLDASDREFADRSWHFYTSSTALFPERTASSTVYEIGVGM